MGGQACRYAERLLRGLGLVWSLEGNLWAGQWQKATGMECLGTRSPAGSRLESLGYTFNRQVCGFCSAGPLTEELPWEVWQ